MGRAIDMEKDITVLKTQMSEMQGVLKEILDTVKIKKEHTDEPKKTKAKRNGGDTPSPKRNGANIKDTSGTS